MTDVSKGICKQPKSFRISDILGDELCERKRKREGENGQEKREFHLNSRCLEDESHYMVLKSKHVTRNESISENRNQTPNSLLHQHIPHWIPMLSNSLKCDKEERVFSGKCNISIGVLENFCNF